MCVVRKMYTVVQRKWTAVTFLHNPTKRTSDHNLNLLETELVEFFWQQKHEISTAWCIIFKITTTCVVVLFNTSDFSVFKIRLFV